MLDSNAYNGELLRFFSYSHLVVSGLLSMFPLPIAQRSGLIGSNCGWNPPGSMLPTIANSPMMGVLGDDPTYHLYC